MNANEYPAGDNEFFERTLTEVRDEGDSIQLTTDIGSINAPKVAGVEPKVGQIVRYYGRGFGYSVRGIFVDGKKLTYKTAEQEEADHRASVLQREKEQKEAFERERPLIDARVSALPEVFQKRLQRFRAGNPDFRWKFEGYELFTCEQAVLFAAACPTRDKLEEFRKMSWDDQLKAVPGMSDGHSGNTFGCAVRLAYWYVTKPENVVLEHGAMVPLVGCRDYGCTHESQPGTEEGQ